MISKQKNETVVTQTQKTKKIFGSDSSGRGYFVRTQ
jgi:ribosomal protein S11